jgi:hypothetical protein
VLRVQKGALVLARPLNYWGNYNDLGTRLLHMLQPCSGTIETFPNRQSEVGLSCCCNPLANAMQQNREEPMAPGALTILNRSDEHLKQIKGKEKTKGRKA